jgi:hypothetical protein
MTAFAAANAKLIPLLVPMDDSVDPLTVFGAKEYIRWADWAGLTNEQRGCRLMIRAINALRRHLSGLGAGQREPIFISHAKLDGRLVAERILAHINDPHSDLRLHLFYDALELEAGEEWTEGLKQAASSGSMISLVTNAYDERPWCNREILWAKEYRRPILLVDIGRSRVERSFPYAGNVPLLRDQLDTAAAIELVLLELLSEALRCDLFLRATAAHKDIIALPRPPELADLAFFVSAPSIQAMVYPDPPLPDAETALLQKLANGRRICALGDL